MSTIHGNASADTITGGMSDDSITGNGGNDLIQSDPIYPNGYNLIGNTNATHNGIKPTGLDDWVRTGNSDAGGATGPGQDWGYILAEQGETSLTNSTGYYYDGTALDTSVTMRAASVWAGGSDVEGTTLAKFEIIIGGEVVYSELHSFTAPQTEYDFAFTVPADADYSGEVAMRVTNMANGGADHLVFNNAKIVEQGVTDTSVFDQGADTVDGGEGNDTIFTGGNNDSVDGGVGDDVINAGIGSDTINAGDGDDMVSNTNNDASLDVDADVINTGAGNDTVQVSYGNDSVDGGADSDTYDASLIGEDITFDMGAGNVSFGSTNQTVTNFENFEGGTASDVVVGSATANEIQTHDGDDSIDAGAGNDSVDAGSGNDVVLVSAGEDLNDGGAGVDLLDASERTEDVTFDMQTGDFSLGSTNQTATNFENYNGGSGDDNVMGNSADNNINGGSGEDVLDGGAGNDSLNGGDGNDTLAGNIGNDTMTGGDGDDFFKIENDDGSAPGHNTITDFLANGDEDTTNLSEYYNDANLAQWNANHPGQQYNNPLQWMREDLKDDGKLNSEEAWGADSSLTLNGVSPGMLTNQNTGVMCFAGGTMIETDHGEVAIEELSQGDMVQTIDHGALPIRWIGAQHLDAPTLTARKDLRPIRIKAGALGGTMPERDLLVSPQHRVLVRSKIVQRMFNTSEVLVAAKQLLMIDGVDIAHDVHEVTYYHFLFENHELVTANGLIAESLYTGPEALKSVGSESRKEILELFPELADISYQSDPTRQLVQGRQGRQMVVRHKNKRKILLENVS